VLTLVCQDHDFSRQSHGNHADGGEDVDQLFVLRLYGNSDLFHRFHLLGRSRLCYRPSYSQLEVGEALEQKKQKFFEKISPASRRWPERDS